MLAFQIRTDHLLVVHLFVCINFLFIILFSQLPDLLFNAGRIGFFALDVFFSSPEESFEIEGIGEFGLFEFVDGGMGFLRIFVVKVIEIGVDGVGSDVVL